MEIAKAISKDLRISTKHSIEICNFIRYKNLLKAEETLRRVIRQDSAIPYKRFNRDLGHKPGMAAGRYPIKACTEILTLLKSVQANAENKGLNTKSLYISKLIANQGSGQYHSGRKRRVQMKRTNIEIEVAEKKTHTKETKK